jgi:hypothetical protein
MKERRVVRLNKTPGQSCKDERERCLIVGVGKEGVEKTDGWTRGEEKKNNPNSLIAGMVCLAVIQHWFFCRGSEQNTNIPKPDLD